MPRFLIFLLLPVLAFATEAPVDTSAVTMDEVVVSASRYGNDLHLSHSNISQAELEQKTGVVDIPMMLTETPGVHAYSDAGNGVGYTYLNIRGFDQKRVGVTINGIPLNDPEDHQVYWVNLPDFVNNVEDIQIQRGITNSMGTTTAIGGTVNLVTDTVSKQQGGKVTFMGGSYDTYKHSFSYNTGKHGSLSSAWRYSQMGSDGYRDRSASTLWSFFGTVKHETGNSVTQFNAYTGKEESQHAWWAINSETMAENRRANPETYENAIDSFQQPHYELHNHYYLSDNMTLKNSLYLIHGEGFYENEKLGKDPVDFGMAPGDDVDLIRRKNVDKNQYGWVPHVEYAHDKGRTIIGGDIYTFHSDHSGNVLEVNGDEVDPFDYYGYAGDKVAWSAYVNEQRRITDSVTLLVDMQYQHKTHEFKHTDVGNFSGADRHHYKVDWSFFNPKGGLFWDTPYSPYGGNLNLYAHVGIAHREPTDGELYDTWMGPDDLGTAPLFRNGVEVDENGDGVVDYMSWSDPYVNEEKALNYEIGSSWRGQNLSFTLNGYWMELDDEIIPFGSIDDDGAPIKGNADKTLHRGIELGLTARLNDYHILKVAASKSWDEFDSFMYHDWAGDIDYSGNRIALFPEHLLTATINSSFDRVRTFVRFRAVGKQHLDNSGNDDRVIDSWTSVDLGLRADISKYMNFSMDFINLLDDRYESSGYYDPWSGGNMFIPAADRHFLVGLHYSF